MKRQARGAIGALLASLAWACHDAPSPWEPPVEEVSPGARQLTFSPGDDRSPAWSSAGDSILYVAEGFGDLARSDGVLVSVPREGGSVSTVFPIVQPPSSTTSALLAPAVEPGTGRVAYAQLLLSEGVCTGDATSCDATDSLPEPPRLQTGRIRVRPPGSVTPPDQDPTLGIAFDGVTFDATQRPFGVPGVWVTRLHPFQRTYNDEGLMPAGPSWDPTGDRLVTSDGLGLLIWKPGEVTATPIPGTDDGSSPAWSPEGDAIAFARPGRGLESSTTCQHLSITPSGPVVLCVESRTQWSVARTTIQLVSPSGGAPIELTEGTEPAWSPDASWVYFARADGIWRVSAAGGTPERIPATDRGTEPAVSPDGAELAFTKRGDNGKGDIWVVPLP